VKPTPTPTPTPISAIRIYYTADVYTPDPPCDTPDSTAFTHNAPSRWHSDCTCTCTCTNVYGEYTEHGYGVTEQSGWLDPDWSRSVVYPNQEDVRPDTPADDPHLIAELIVGQVLQEHDVSPRDPLWDDYITPDSWIYETITNRLGYVEEQHPSYYAHDPDVNHYTGQEVMIAAHVYNWE
jgi:hypothetical protein